MVVKKSCVATCLEVFGCSWNECPDQHGITVWMCVEWVSESAWNPHLHYVLDLRTRQWHQRHARGEMIVARYVDDNVMGVQDNGRRSLSWRSCRSARPGSVYSLTPRRHD